MEEIEILNDKIAELKNSLKCADCGTLNSNSSDFCSKCGSPLPKQESEEEIDINDADEIDDDDVIIITPQKPE